MTAAAPAGTGRETHPLSVTQEALWYRSRLAPTALTYNETISIRKDGPLELAALRRAFTEIVRRHQAWRSGFELVDGQPAQVVHPVPDFELAPVDLSELSAEEAQRQAVRTVAAASRVPYDLARGPLVRPRLFRFPADHHRLYLPMHHLIFDGVSLTRVVLPELVQLYDAFRAGKPSPLPEPPLRYGDYARWEQRWIAESRAERRLAHWCERLTPLPILALPHDRPRPSEPRRGGGAAPLELPRGEVERLHAAAQASGSTLFQALATCWALLLGHYSGQAEVAFAAAADLRQRPELQNLVGCCLTPLVLRVDLGGEPSAAEAIVRVRNELLDGLDQLVPFERVVRELPPSAEEGANPVYQTMLVLEPATETPDPAWSLHQIDSVLADAVGSFKLDLELQLDERADGRLVGQLIYDRDLFETATAERMVGHWLAICAAVAADPAAEAAAIPLLGEAERRRQLVEWNATAVERPAGTIAGAIEARALACPEAIAVRDGEREVGYAELDRLATQAAEQLREGGAGSGAVALPAGPSIELVAAALGALKAGLVHEPDMIAIGEAASLDLALSLAGEIGIGPGSRALALEPSLLTVPAVELWMPLVAGATVVLAPPEAATDGGLVSRLVAAEGIVFLHASPSAWETLIETGLRPSRSLRGLSGGEALAAELAGRILDRCRVLWNAFGTDRTGYCTLGRVERGAQVTIGRPLANRRAYVLDARGQPQPIGVDGELTIEGEAFGSGAVIRTGETAHWLADGQLQLCAAAAESPVGERST